MGFGLLDMDYCSGDYRHSLFEPFGEFLFQFIVRPQGHWLLGPALLDVLRHKAAQGFQQPVSGRAARWTVPVLLYKYGGKARYAAEVIHDSLNHLGRVGYVRPTGSDSGQELADSRVLDLFKGGFAFLALTLRGLLAGVLNAQTALSSKVAVAVLHPPAEVLFV